MSYEDMARKRERSGYRILAIAIAASLAWHVFWLSAVKIVSSPLPKSAVKFSKVAFLGPILTRVSMEVRASPANRSLLEKRYRKIAGETSYYEDDAPAKSPDSKYDGRYPAGAAERKLILAIDDAVAGKRLEPDYPAE